MANFTSIGAAFSDPSDLNASFDIKFVNVTRAIDVTYAWICKVSRSSVFEYAQGVDVDDQEGKSLTAVTADIEASAISGFMNVTGGSDAFEIEANEFGWVITDEGSTGTTNITLTEVPEVLPASGYIEKYSFVFWWDNRDANNKYKVSFLKDGYGGGVTPLIPGPKPWVETIKGQLDTSDNPILGSEAKMQILIDGSGYADLDADLLESDYKDFIVKLIQDPDGTPVIKWVGLLLPNSASRDYVGQVKNYNITAVDGLADLKNKSYSTTGLNDGSTYNGFENFLTIIKTALEKVADFSELQLDFRINLGIFSDQMTNITGQLHTDQALKDNEIVQELFSEIENDETKFDSCYEVLKKILIAFDCTLLQNEGFYYIIATGEQNTTVWEYDWATLTEQSRTIFTKSIDVSDYVWFGQGTLYKTPPYKTFDVRLFNKNYDPELIVNGGFDSGISDWANGDADDSSNTWTDINSTILDSGNGVLELEYSDVAASASYHVHTSASFQLTVAGTPPSVQVTIIIQYVSSTPSSITASNIRLRLWNSTNGYKIGTGGYQEITNKGTFITITETFDVQSYTVTTNFLDIEVQVNDGSTTDLLIYVDSASLKQGSVNTPVDWLYTGVRTTVQPEPKEQIVYVSEQQESDNDICAIKDIGGTYVSTWGRPLILAETRSLIEILQQYRFNSNRGFMSYIRGTISDPDETINAKNVLTLPDGDFRIIGLKKDYRSARVTLDLIQIIYVELSPPPSDISFGTGILKLSSQYGQSTE